MPMYVFVCRSCGRFEVRMTMKDASSEYPCSGCGQLAARDYSSVTLGSLGGAARQRMEESSRPTVKQRGELFGRPFQPHTHAGSQRPWQVGH